MGSGTRLKLLEAMAAGCAIVATPLAASGLAGAEDAFLLAETEDEFAKKTIQAALQFPVERKIGSRGARDRKTTIRLVPHCPDDPGYLRMKSLF